jgi:hypothetical protein
MSSYEELSSPSEQHADCVATSHALGLGTAAGGRAWQRAAERATQPAPSIHYDEFPREIPKADIRVSEAAQRLANALHLHLD